MTNNIFQAVILAGGKSTRMGEDKALLKIHGTTLLEYMQNILQEAGASKVWISGDYNFNNSIVDIKPKLGPLGGIYSISKNVQDGVYIFIPVDMPLIEIWQIQELVAALYNNKKYDSAYYQDNIVPFAININSKTRQCISNLIESKSNSHSIKNFLSKLDNKTLDYPAKKQYAFANCNDQQQWRKILK